MSIEFKYRETILEDGWYLVRVAFNNIGLQVAEYTKDLDRWQWTGIDYDVVYSENDEPETLTVICALDLPLMAETAASMTACIERLRRRRGEPVVGDRVRLKTHHDWVGTISLLWQSPSGVNHIQVAWDHTAATTLQLTEVEKHV